MAMNRLYLVCQAIGLVSFGRKKNEKKKSVYDCTLIEDSLNQFRRQREDGNVDQVLLDITIIISFSTCALGWNTVRTSTIGV